MAATKGHVGIIELLLGDARTNVLETDYRGRTALHLACNLNRVSIIILLLLGIGRETPALSPLVADQLLDTRDIYARRALDYRLLSRQGQTADAATSDNEATNMNKLRELLDLATEYEDGDLRYSLLGKGFVFAGEDECAIKSYQMRCQWVEVENEFYFDMGCTCDNCGTESSIQSARMVCRTCADIDLCERCHGLYQEGRCSERVCSGHEFLRVPTIPVDELRNNFPRPQDGEPHLHWQYARTTEMVSAWMDELRMKFSISTRRDDSPLNHSDFDLENSPFLCIAKLLISPQMYTARLRLHLPTLDNTSNA